MENIANITAAIFALSLVGFVLAYSIILGKVLAKPVKALFSVLF